MFENACHLTFKSNQYQRGLKTLRSVLVPILKKQPGLLTLAVIPDPEAARVTLLSIWQSQACARATEANSEYRHEIARLDDLIVEEETNPPPQPLSLPRLQVSQN